MNLSIIGYGKMGHAIEALALQRGHQITCTIDNTVQMAEKDTLLKQSQVAIEFTTPATAADNLRHLLNIGIPVVCGTTGWYDSYPQIAELCKATGGALFTATNFSIGMNIMFALNEKLASLMSGRNDYSVDISETHHIHKLDAPSGTAITLRDQIIANGERHSDQIPIHSYRIGEVPGTHIVRYDSPVDTITLSHEAHSREGLALGAILAAEFIVGKHGIFTMKDLL